MRRLPIFLVADVSESMVGDTLDQLRDGIAAIVSTLRNDPYALETAHMSVIAFAGRPRSLSPLTEMFAFHPPDLLVGGGTALGAAMDHLMKEIDRNVVTTTRDRKGDWKPLIFLLTDGAPTDKVSSAVKRWNRSYRDRANLIAVSIVGHADHGTLKQITDEVIVFDDTAEDAFSRFIRWISASIQSQSRSVGVGKDDKVSLAKLVEGVVSPFMVTGVSPPSSGVDERFAVILGRCLKDCHHYIVKFERDSSGLGDDSPVTAATLDCGTLRAHIFLVNRAYLINVAVLVYTGTAADLTRLGGGDGGARRGASAFGTPCANRPDPL